MPDLEILIRIDAEGASHVTHFVHGDDLHDDIDIVEGSLIYV